MPKSKTSQKRANKLEKRRTRPAAGAAAQPVPYVEMLDRLRETLNRRFYEEQGFPHLEILAENYDGPCREGDLSDHLQLQHFFIGMAVALTDALRGGTTKLSMERREDACAAVAYAIAATLLGVRRDFRDASGWMGGNVLGALRRRWGVAKMKAAGMDEAAERMDDRSLACYFGMDFVMTILDMTGELAERGGSSVISVTTCKDEVIAAFTSYVTANAALGGSRLVDLEDIFARNAVTPEFREDYPEWKPEAADALNPVFLGFNALPDVDTAYILTLLDNARFLHDMRALYVRFAPEEIPQGLREETLMAYALRYGPRSQKAFAEGREPTEMEMDQDAEVINLLVMTCFLHADAAFVQGVDEDPETGTKPEESAVRTYSMTLEGGAEKAFEAWRAARDAAERKGEA